MDRSWWRSSWVEAGVDVFWLYGQQPPGGGRRLHPAAGPRARQRQHAGSLWTGQKQFALKQTCNSQACRAAGSCFRLLLSLRLDTKDGPTDALLAVGVRNDYGGTRGRSFLQAQPSDCEGFIYILISGIAGYGFRFPTAPRISAGQVAS